MRPAILFSLLALLLLIAAAGALLWEDESASAPGGSEASDHLIGGAGADDLTGNGRGSGATATGADGARTGAAHRAGLAPDQEAASEDDVPKVLLVWGQVTARGDLKPQQAQLAATTADGSLATAEAKDGNFRIMGPPGTIARLVVTAQQFAAAIMEDIPEGSELTVVLEPSVTFRGRVLSMDKKPLEGVEITLLRKGQVEPRPVRTTTNESGGFLIDSVPAGRYDVSLIKDEVAPHHDNKLVIPPEGLEKDYVMHPGFTLLGEVVSFDRKYNIQGAQIEVIDRIIKGQSVKHQSRNLGPFVTDAEGRFTITALAPGEVRLLVKAQGYGAHVQSFNIRRADEDKNQVQIRLKEGGSVIGTVTDPDGNPVGWARVTVQPKGKIQSGRDYDDLMGFLFGTAEFEDEVGPLPPAVTADAQGRFVISGTPPGKGFLTAHDPKKRFAPSRRTPVILTKASDSAVIDLQLRPAVSVSGVVVDEAGQPVEEATVALPPSRTITAADGTFTLNAVREGKHHLWTRHRHFDQYREPLEIGSEGLHGVIVKLVAGKILTGVVTDRARKPVVGARILVMDRSRKHRLGRGETNYDGSFHLGGLKHDLVFMRVVAEGFFAESFNDLETGSKPLQIVLTERPWEKSSDIAGTVIRAQGGAPIYNFTLQGMPAANIEIFEGTYYIQNLSPGVKSFRIHAPGYQRHRVRNVEVAPGALVTVPPVRLHRAASLTLTVRDGRNKVVRKGLSIRLRKVGDNKNPGWARRSKPPGPKGTTHVFPELRHGLYNLVVGYKGHISRTRSIRIRGDRKLNIRLRARRRRK